MARPRSDIQARLVEAARARFLSQGVDGASLREIARDAGTNIGMVVYYFPTKDDLFLAVVEEVYAGVVHDMEQIFGLEDAARERLRRAFVRLGRTSDLELDVIRLVVREALSSSTRLRRIIGRSMTGHVPLILETLAKGIREGEFDATIPVPFIFAAVVGLGGLPQLLRRAAPSLPFMAGLPRAEALADISIDVLFRAVGARAVGAREDAPVRLAPPLRPRRPRSRS
ncbi:MAG TPA: TetR/AcrR family transcriptional regulator [Polyangiaceae bacterium]|jgi:AcrR family transcriptional regulator|nr:TetR/AcrR family transcriptional regulator [Polyangiaceae bacterium]